MLGNLQLAAPPFSSILEISRGCPTPHLSHSSLSLDFSFIWDEGWAVISYPVRCHLAQHGLQTVQRCGCQALKTFWEKRASETGRVERTAWRVNLRTAVKVNYWGHHGGTLSPESYTLNAYRIFPFFIRWDGGLFTPGIWKKHILTLTDSICFCFDCIDE